MFDPQIDPQELYQAEALDKHFGGAKIKRHLENKPPLGHGEWSSLSWWGWTKFFIFLELWFKLIELKYN